jgi:hypothetical protein
MAPGDMLAAGASPGDGAASWSWYVPVGLTALVIAVVMSCMYFRETVLRWAPWLFILGPAAIGVAAVAGVEGADEIAESFAGPAPKDFVEFIGMWIVGVGIMLVAEPRRRGRAAAKTEGGTAGARVATT